jgi:alkanesulfonate monooxygenase SsuD/methylene tetrahydromethanopterin reductase-like flavin-dependent oxidoreductase (luciferase family)
VVSAGSARKAARRRTKITTGFNAVEEIKALSDAYHDEAQACGFPAGPGHLGLRRRVVVAGSAAQAHELAQAASERLQRFVKEDPRLRQARVPDAPQKGAGFALSADEFITGTPGQVAENIIAQCRRVGAEHFLTVLHWGAPLDEIVAAHELFGREVIPLLRKAALQRVGEPA